MADYEKTDHPKIPTGKTWKLTVGENDGHILQTFGFQDGFLRTLGNNVGELAHGVYDIASHPLETLSSLKNALIQALSSPNELSETFKEKAKQYVEQVDRTAKHGTSYEQGKLAGDIVANVLPFAAGGKKAVTGVKFLSKLEMFTNNIRTSKIADRTVTIGNDVWKKGAAVYHHQY